MQRLLSQVARKIAMGIDAVDLAMQAVEATGKAFEVDAVALQQQVVEEIAPQAKSPDDHYALTRYLGRLLPPLLKADRYEAAKSHVELAVTADKKSKDADLIKQWTRREEQVAALEKAFAAAQAALKTLDADPVNAAANAVAGKYACFVKDDWANGIPMLALGDDAELQKLAEQELKGTDKQADQLALADAWYNLGQKRQGAEKTAHARDRRS